MERLHADKHKLEDRLNSLEKSVMYESTILNDDWMEGELCDDSIDDTGVSNVIILILMIEACHYSHNYYDSNE